jgi:hypothetical protein
MAGCNGAGGATQVDGLSPVAAIQKVADTAGSDSATYTFDLAGSGVAVKGSGAYRGGDHPAARMVFDSLKMAGFSFPAGTEFRLLDKVLYLKSPKGGLIPGVGNGDWVQLPMDDVQAQGNSIGGLNLTMANPADQLKKMLDTQDVTTIGTETVDGVATTHYRANVDSSGTGTVTEQKSSSSSNELSRQLEQQLQDTIKSSLGLSKPVTVDAWVDRDYHARKLSVALPFLGDMTLTMKFSDFGSDVNVDAPAGAKKIDLNNMISGQLGNAFGKAFGDQLGNALGGSAGSSSSLSDQFSQQLRDQIDKSLSGGSTASPDTMGGVVAG